MKERKDIYWRAYLIYFGFVALMLLVLFQTLSLQWQDVAKNLDLTEENEGKIPTRLRERIPRRGEILDANRTPWVTSVSFYDIHMDPQVVEEKIFLEEISNLSRELAKMYPSKSAGEYERDIRRARTDGKRYLLIKKRVTNEERRKLNEFPIFNLGRLKGGLIDTDETIIRKRPQGELLKRTLGFVQKNADGTLTRVGIEGAYNDYLTGEKGEEIEQKISTGWKRTGQIVKDAVEGADVITTIDKEIQEVAHSELYRQMQNQGAKHGTAIVMEVSTGHVKAIANLKRGRDGNYYESYNYGIGTKEVPGSTFKLASLMAALEDKKIHLSDTVGAYGKYNFYGEKLTDSKTNGYGRITIERAFELSSNVISRVINNAYKNEPEAFVKRLRSFGLGDPLGIDLEGESVPTLYAPGSSNWSGISLPWMAIGYEVQQTPLQTLAFYNAVANNGKLVRPLFVSEIRRNGQIVKRFDPVTLRSKICSNSTLTALQRALEGVIESGTGSALKSAYFKIAGKTGTARVLNSDLRYGNKGEEKHQASFVGYFPAKNPIYSCIVVITAPNKDIYGASVSGTVFSAIANKVYASTLSYHKAINEKPRLKGPFPKSMSGSNNDLQTVYRNLQIPFSKKIQEEWVNTKVSDKGILFQTRNVAKNTMPNILGLSAKDAVYLIERSGMMASIKGNGKVVAQYPQAGSSVIDGGIAQIVLK
ncbi:MAG: penicillin-binding transpeptidase domain-containing protein [Crocinitomicaceae bacterium]|nr:penicillin-binding transpeptidase domain-containing protein [Crocinitomicaceae bacterium]